VSREALAIARQTFLEVVRQPVHCVVVLATLGAYALSPHIALFSLREEGRLLDEFGTSTVLLAGWALTCLAASGVVRREIETRTALTLLSKPVSRGAFLAGKFLGVAGFLGLATWTFTVALLLVDRRGPVAFGAPDLPVAAAGFGGFAAGLLAAVARHHRGGRPFSSSLLGSLAVTLTCGWAAAGFFAPDGTLQTFGQGYDPLIAASALLAFLAVAILAAFAVSISAWTGRGGTFVVTGFFFVAGLAVGSLPPPAAPWRALLFWIPDLALFWTGDLFYTDGAGVPPLDILLATVTAALYSGAFLALGTWLLSRKGL